MRGEEGTSVKAMGINEDGDVQYVMWGYKINALHGVWVGVFNGMEHSIDVRECTFIYLGARNLRSPIKRVFLRRLLMLLLACPLGPEIFRKLSLNMISL